MVQNRFIILIAAMMFSLSGSSQIVVAKKLFMNGNLITDAVTGDTLATVEWVEDTLNDYYIATVTIDSIESKIIQYDDSTSTIQGAGAANQISYFTSSNEITGDNDLYFDGSFFYVGSFSAITGIGLYSNDFDVSSSNQIQLTLNDGGTLGDIFIDNSVFRLQAPGVPMLVDVDTNRFMLLGNDSLFRIYNGGAKFFTDVDISNDFSVGGNTTLGNSDTDSTYVTGKFHIGLMYFDPDFQESEGGWILDNNETFNIGNTTSNSIASFEFENTGYSLLNIGYINSNSDYINEAMIVSGGDTSTIITGKYLEFSNFTKNKGIIKDESDTVKIGQFNTQTDLIKIWDGNIDVSENLTVDGTTTLGNATTDLTTVNGKLTSDSIGSTTTGRTALTDFILYPPHATMNFSDSSVFLTMGVNAYQQVTNPEDSLFRVRFESNGLTVNADTVMLLSEPAHYRYEVAVGFSTVNADAIRLALYNENGIVQSMGTSTTNAASEEEISFSGVHYDDGTNGKLWLEIKTVGGEDLTLIDGTFNVFFYHKIY